METKSFDGSQEENLLWKKSMHEMKKIARNVCTSIPRGERSGSAKVAQERGSEEINRSDDLCSVREGFKNKFPGVIY